MASKGKAARLQERRHQGPSKFEEQRGPNTGAWENTYIPIRRDQSQQTGVSDPDRFVNSHRRSIMR